MKFKSLSGWDTQTHVEYVNDLMGPIMLLLRKEDIIERHTGLTWDWCRDVRANVLSFLYPLMQAFVACLWSCC